MVFRRLPECRHEQIAADIVRAIDDHKPRLARPRSSYFLGRLTALSPPSFGIRVGRWTKVDRIYTDANPGVRAEYEERIRR